MSKKQKSTKNNTEVTDVNNSKNIEMPNQTVGEANPTSYEDVISYVGEEWRTNDENYRGWVNETYPDHVIVRMDKDFWKITYTSDSSGITFADQNMWEKVKLQTEWIAKHIENLLCIKSLAPKEEGETRIGGYAILWGDEDHKDLHGDYFTSETKELTSVMKGMGEIPFFFNHGFDSTLKASVIGSVDVMDEDDIGVWFEAKIKEHKIYRKYVQPLLDSEALFPSSGVLPAALKKVKSTGEITQWPIMEMTGTHVPAEHRMLDTPISAIKNYYSDSKNSIKLVLKSIGIEDETEEEATGDEKSHVSTDDLLNAKIDIGKLDLHILSGGSI